MTKGVVLIANNNGSVDYVKQAMYCADRVQQYLELPVTLITDSYNYAVEVSGNIFDKIISTDYQESNNSKIYFDGALSHKVVMFKNHSRTVAYYNTPYDQTILMDTDYLISSDILNKCFSMTTDLMMYKDSYDLSNVRDVSEFKYISDKGIDFYWATVVYFEKSKKNDIYFNLIDHIEENWKYYQNMYDINSNLFRNDFAFSIAIHIMSGFTSNNVVSLQLPGKHYYVIDKDILWNIKNENMTFLVHKKKYEGQYTLLSTTGLDVHVMNKFSLERIINNE
jgi:hypothetical protein